MLKYYSLFFFVRGKERGKAKRRLRHVRATGGGAMSAAASSKGGAGADGDLLARVVGAAAVVSLLLVAVLAFTVLIPPNHPGLASEDRTVAREVAAEARLPQQQQHQQQQQHPGADGKEYGPRPKLLFNHFPKGGGKYAIKALQGLLPRGSLRIVSEAGESGEREREKFFVVANVREACSYYMSLWHFDVQQHGLLGRRMKNIVFPDGHEDLRHILEDRDVDNLENFREFFRLVRGIWSSRLRRSHEDLAVDCWVRTSSLDADLARCLRLYEAQGGELLPEAEAFLSASPGGDAGGDGAVELLEERVHPSVYDRPCEYFFPAGSAERAAILEEPACSVIEGGCDCCGALPYPPIADGARWPESWERPVCFNLVLGHCLDGWAVRAARSAGDYRSP